MSQRRIKVFISVLLLTFIANSFQIINATYDLAEEDQPADDGSFPLKGEMVGGNFQGDMILSKQQLRNLNFGPRNGIINKRYRWPKNSEGIVIVPYGFKDSHEYTSKQKNLIRTALKEIEAETCIQFLEDESNPKHIQIFSGRGCFSDVGRQSSKQNQLSIKKDSCERKGIIMHEFLHALGFYHMQSAHDRQKYVRILHQNVRKEFSANFAQYSNQVISHFGTSYDIDSIMHYNRKAFTKNGEDTIETLNPVDNNRIGQRKQLSPGDIERINNMYKCT